MRSSDTLSGTGALLVQLGYTVRTFVSVPQKGTGML